MVTLPLCPGLRVSVPDEDENVTAQPGCVSPKLKTPSAHPTESLFVTVTVYLTLLPA
jgi:hypothetical protein